MKKRIASLLLGTCCISFGIAGMAKAAIGMSPISSFPYVVSLILPQLTLGEWVLVWNAFFALLQIPVMGRSYKPYLLSQIPLAVLLGKCTDLVKFLLSFLVIEAYPLRLLAVFLGLVATALGIHLTVHADLIMNGPEAFLHSLSDRIGVKFGTLKVIFDLSNMTMAIVTSFLSFGTVLGVREGTILSAVFTGVFVNLFSRLFSRE